MSYSHRPRHTSSSSSSSFRRFGSGDRSGSGSGKRPNRSSPPPNGSAAEKKQPERQIHVRRPGYASSSGAEKYEQILLTANHYQITIPNITCHVYDIRIIPVRKNVSGHYIHIFNQDRNEEKKRLRKLLNEHNRLVMQKIVQSNCKPGMLFHDPATGSTISPVFDGFYNFYTAKPLTGLARPTPAPAASSSSSSSSSGVDWLGRPRKAAAPVSNLMMIASSFQRDTFREYMDIELDPGNVCTFEVNIHYSTSVDLNLINKYIQGASGSSGSGSLMVSPPLDALKAVDIILRHGPTINRIPIAHALYSQDGESYPVAGNKDVIHGHFQSVRAKEAGATLNIDQISAVFFTPGPILEVLCRMDGARDAGDPDFQPGRTPFDQFMRNLRSSKKHMLVQQLQKAFNNLAVETHHEKLQYKRKFKVKNVTSESAKDMMFELTQDLDPSNPSSKTGKGCKLSVADYYKSKYQIDLKYPDLPCLQTGSDSRPVYFPLELVHIQAKQQTVNLTNKERSYIMAKSGEQTTQKRFSIIDRAAKTVISDSVQQLSEFSISMQDQPISVFGNIVPHPVLDFGDRVSYRPRAGKWDMKDKKVYRAAESGLKDWLVVNVHMFHHSASERRRTVNHFVRGLMTTGRGMGVSIGEPYKQTAKDSHEEDLFFDLSMDNDLHYPWKLQNVLNRNHLIPVKGNPNACKFPKLKAIIFIIDEKKDDHYNAIKVMCDVQFNLMSQVVFSKNVQQMDEASHITLLQNLILKMNTKLGGINCLISDADRLRNIVDRYTMIMGADVTHPALSDSVTSSIACLTASCDREQYFYEVCLRVQLSYKETITDMYDMSYELIEKFRQRRGQMPSKIIFFRDGVSEGQFDQVLREEVAALRTACQKLMTKQGSDQLPAITVIIVRKRHHTRFTPVHPDQGVGKTQNVPAGTTVDTQVVSPVDFDFYMCSHEATVGTTRPTHYVVLVDESSMKPEELFRITFNLCHLYPPTTKSISIPIPVQYAHLAAKRARSHAIVHNGAGRLGKRKHPNELERVARELNEAIRVPDRSPAEPVNMYYI